MSKRNASIKHEGQGSEVTVRLVNDLIEAVKNRSADDRRWFPNGIDSLNVTVSVTAQGTTIALALAGPTLLPSLASLEDPRGRFLAFALSEERVMNACTEAGKVAANLADCNLFVKAVGTSVGAPIAASANADRIVDIIQSAPWTPLARGDNRAALQKAAEGKFVIAGMKQAEFTKPHTNGHVAVVHGHEVAGHPGFPHASWGSIAGNGTVDGSIRRSFPVIDLAKIHYSFRDI